MFIEYKTKNPDFTPIRFEVDNGKDVEDEEDDYDEEDEDEELDVDDEDQPTQPIRITMPNGGPIRYIGNDPSLIPQDQLQNVQVYEVKKIDGRLVCTPYNLPPRTSSTATSSSQQTPTPTSTSSASTSSPASSNDSHSNTPSTSDKPSTSTTIIKF